MGSVELCNQYCCCVYPVIDTLDRVSSKSSQARSGGGGCFIQAGTYPNGYTSEQCHEVWGRKVRQSRTTRVRQKAPLPKLWVCKHNHTLRTITKPSKPTLPHLPPPHTHTPLPLKWVQGNKPCGRHRDGAGWWTFEGYPNVLGLCHLLEAWVEFRLHWWFFPRHSRCRDHCLRVQS